MVYIANEEILRFLLGLFFDSEDGGDVFLWNVG
jgi:hypothetical protein